MASIRPRGSSSHNAPDLRLIGNGEQLARVEVLSNHRNTTTWEKKFTRWRSEKAGPTVWIYETRENIGRFGFVEILFFRHILA